MMVQDEREELINELCLYLQPHIKDVGDLKAQLYIMLSSYEITNRSTEIAVTDGEKNEKYLKRFLVAKTVTGCTERTIYFYGTTIPKVLSQIGKTVDEITPDDIRLYMALRQKRDKVSLVTISNEMRCISSFYTWLMAEELITRNPMLKVDRVKQPKQQKEAFSELEIEKLRNEARGEKQTLIIELLLSTGCRVSELAQIRLTEITDDRILIHGKGNKDRYVYLNAKAILALEQYIKCRKDKNPYLFPQIKSVAKLPHKKGNFMDAWKFPENVEPDGHMDKSSVEGMTRKLGRKAGIEKSNPHKFRRTCATMALRRGMPIEQVSKMLGHESIETTQIYLELTEDELKQAHKKFVI